MNSTDLFKQWIAEYEALIHHLIIGFEAERSLQEELFQEIALNLWRAIPSFRQEASVKTFIARIAHNVLVTHVAKSVRTITTENETDEVIDEHTSHDTTPYQSLDKAQRQKRLQESIRNLKLNQQQVILLALEGMSYQEISEVLGISTNLVGVRLQRAKHSLTQLLES